MSQADGIHTQFFVYNGDADGLQAALAKTVRFQCECGDSLSVGGQITERSQAVCEWKARHTGKQHVVVKLES